MKIVILNDSFFSEEHLNQLRNLGDLVIYDGTSSTQEAIERTADADIVLGDGFLAEFNKEYFNNVPNLKFLALNTTAFTMVDTDTAKEKGVQVANCPGFSKRSVAEMALALMFAAVRRIPYGDKKYRAGFMDQDPGSPEGRELISYDLYGKTLGIVGVGRIGSELAKLGTGIGMNVIGWNRSKREDVKLVELDELVTRADVIVMTLAYSNETHGTLSKELLEKLKPEAVIVSIAKRDLIDMDTLFTLLNEKKIRAAAFDWAQCKEGDPILNLDNVVFTPHTASYTAESFYENLPNMIVGNTRAFIEGKPVNVVNS
jgi:phosphoglycerate dehydrogenase-like enzyme